MARAKFRGTKVDEQVAKLLHAAEAAEWRIDGGGSSHWKVYPPGEHAMVPLASTPSDKRGTLNVRSRLRRAGLDV
jgi:hypothetical protein